MKKCILLFIFIFLTACSNETQSIYGVIVSIEEEIIRVNCSDSVGSSNKSKDDIGYSCAIKITESTIIKNQAGDVVPLEELNKYNEASVYFEEPITINAASEGLTLKAKEITVFKKSK